MVDIRRPARKRVISTLTNHLNQRNPALITNKQKGHSLSNSRKRLKQLALPTLAIFTVLVVILFLNLKQTIANSISRIQQKILAVEKTASASEISQTIQPLKKINTEIKNLVRQTDYYGLRSLAYFGGIIIPPLKILPEIMDRASSLSDLSVNLAKNISYLEANAFDLMASQKGEKLISTLNNIKKEMEEAERLGKELNAELKNLGEFSPRLSSIAKVFDKNYNSISPAIPYLKNFLNGFIALLKQSKDQHILFILQNPSEMRPAGGFIGSFGDLTLNRGNLKNIDIDDIYNADRQLKSKLIPPKELQNITTEWGARDANWFFDFPTSARKVISLLEQSNLYQSKSVQFQGATAINTNVLKTIFEIIGPVKLEKYDLTINDNNFLKEIQREVEAGRDKKPGENPKRILSSLTPLIMEKLRSLDANQKKLLTKKVKTHLANKDIMFYFKDWKIQNFLEKTGVAGDLLRLPKSFSGDYLAVVNANIGGGKSDAFIKQKISLKSSIEADGFVANELSITKTHNGQNEKDWWYRAPNKTYIKILAPEKSKLLYVKGNDKLPTVKKMTYSREYEYDFDLANIEKNADLLEILQTWLGNEFGKSYFGTWFTTPAGKTKTLFMQYENGIKLNIRDNMSYEFIFEKQSGVDEALEYSITAPPGYYWKESANENFIYSADKPKSREIITLTLLKAK